MAKYVRPSQQQNKNANKPSYWQVWENGTFLSCTGIGERKSKLLLKRSVYEKIGPRFQSLRGRDFRQRLEISMNF